MCRKRYNNGVRYITISWTGHIEGTRDTLYTFAGGEGEGGRGVERGGEGREEGKGKRGEGEDKLYAELPRINKQ